MYNAKTGIGWWIDIVDFRLYSKEMDAKDKHFHLENCTQLDPSIVSRMTVLSHVKFDFENRTLQGWYYAQLR
jgi:hypothetical protein